jgi:hypothetical protein
MSDETFWLSIWSIVIAGLVSMMFICNYYGNLRHDRLISAGYEQVMVVGSNCPKWKQQGEVK